MPWIKIVKCIYTYRISDLSGSRFSDRTFCNVKITEERFLDLGSVVVYFEISIINEISCDEREYKVYGDTKSLELAVEKINNILKNVFRINPGIPEIPNEAKIES